jgi:hypothetical protein
MSTLDSELNDFGAQLAMLGGHAAGDPHEASDRGHTDAADTQRVR